LFVSAECVLVYLVERQDFLPLLGCYTLMSLAYVVLAFLKPLSFKEGLLLSLALRLLLLPSLPSLSDDFYRFIWDGQLALAGISPFRYLPSEVLANPALHNPGVDLSLVAKMNSPHYYSIYPPVCQLIFRLSAWVNPVGEVYPAVLTMRLCALMAEGLTTWALYRLLLHWRLPVQRLWVYLLNPLVILELVGNLHFEAFMIAFLTLAIWLLQQGKFVAMGGGFALAIAAKLLPLMFLPLLLKVKPFSKVMLIYGVCLMVGLLLFVPFFADKALLLHLSESVNLYFAKFEFNASIFYLFRWLGFAVRGFDVIQTVGSRLVLYVPIAIVAMLLVGKSCSVQQWVQQMMVVLTLYLLLSTIVHPWYVTTLVAFSVLTQRRYALLWSYTVFFSYSAYAHPDFKESAWWLAAEYLVLGAAICWEWVSRQKDS